jgi:hypothetical protein
LMWWLLLVRVVIAVLGVSAVSCLIVIYKSAILCICPE